MEGLKKFKLKANVVFWAKDIDDAFRRLEDHFYSLRDGDNIEDNLLHQTLEKGEIHIEPWKD